MRPFIALMLCAISSGLAGCSNSATDNGADGHHADERSAESAAITNRIAIPHAVRQNLGITFVKVERRPVQQTMRFPGEFELRPDARREYRVMAPGRVNLHV